MKRKIAIDAVVAELTAAQARFPEFEDMMDGYAAIWEETDRLWKDIWINSKTPLPDGLEIELHARKVAAMALRFLIECC